MTALAVLDMSAAERAAPIGQPFFQPPSQLARRLRPIDCFLAIIDSQMSTSEGGASGRALKIESGLAV